MNLVLLGANNPETIRVIRALERAQPNFKVLGFIDNDPKKKGISFYGYPIFGGFDSLDQLDKKTTRFVNLITGSTKVRFETSRHLAEQGFQFENLIHPTIDLTMTSLGVGNYIQEGVIIQAEAKIGNNSSIHMAALISHEVTIGDSVFVAHAVSISGSVSVGSGTFIGTNATILPRLKIGRWATIGAGAVVTKDVPDYAVVVGNPAKVLRIVEPEYDHADIFQRIRQS